METATLAGNSTKVTTRKWLSSKVVLWLIILSYAIILVTTYRVKWETKSVIVWDVSGYYHYLPAAFIFKDLDKASFMSYIDNTYHPTMNGNYGIVPLENGNVAFKFTMGMALLYMPFFLLAHAITTLFTSLPADGYSYFYQMGISLSGMTYALFGLFFLRKLLLNYFSETITALILLILAFGTNLYHYSLNEAGMSHSALFCLYAALLFFTYKWHLLPRKKYAAGIGVIIGLLALTRPTEIISVLIPLLWGVYRFSGLKAKLLFLWQHRGQIVLMMICAFLIGSLQLLYWKYISGSFLLDSYKGEGQFNFMKPQILNGLLSYKKGLLIYTPVMFLAFAGFFYIRKYVPHLFVLLLVFVVVNLFIVFSWNPWWYGGSFGMRALIQSFAIMSLPLACFLTNFFTTKLKRAVILAVIACFITLNIIQTVQYKKTIIHYEDMTKERYWDNFLKLNKKS